MKQSKRDAVLDALLGKKVYLVFKANHGKPITGILQWNNKFEPERFHSWSYYIEKDNGERVFFKKSYVNYAREVH